MKKVSHESWLPVGGIILALCWTVFVFTLDLNVVVKDDINEKSYKKSFASQSEEVQPIISIISESEPVEVESMRDANTRVFKVQKEVGETNPQTQETIINNVESTIVEKCPNICYKDESGAWPLTDTSFEATDNGFSMTKCGYQVSIGNSLADPIYFTIEGKTIGLKLSHFLISDGATTQNIGELNSNINSALNQTDHSKIIFSNPFDNNLADIEYVAEKKGFHQNIIIKQELPLPDGFNTANTRIYIYTEILANEFIDDAKAWISFNEEIINADNNGIIADAGQAEEIEFRAIINGEEKLLSWFGESEILSEDGNAIFADRQLFRNPAEGKLYLIESLPLSSLAYFEYPITWDYVYKSGTISGTETWTANNSYRIADDLTITGTVKIEPGTLIEINNDDSIIVSSNGVIIAQGEPWNYIVFKGAGAADYNEAIRLNGASSDCRISYCKISTADSGIKIQNCELNTPIENCIIANCYKGIEFLNNAANDVRNCLIYNCNVSGIEIAGIEGTYNLYNNTIDSCGTCIKLSYYSEDSYPIVDIKDNLITQWTTYGIQQSGGGGTLEVNNNGYWKSTGNTNYISGVSDSNAKLLDVSPYESVDVIGDYYINDVVGGGLQLRYKGAGTASEAGFNNNDQFTFLKPQVYNSSNDEISKSTEWVKRADPQYTSSRKVTIGYHHNRIDYLIDDTILEFSCDSGKPFFKIDPGVVTAISSSGNWAYILVKDYFKIICKGDWEDKEYIQIIGAKSASMKVELPQVDQDATVGIKLETDIDYLKTDRNIIQYTIFSGLRNGLAISSDSFPRLVSNNYESANYEVMEVRDCIFRKCCRGIRTNGFDFLTANNLFHYNTYGIYNDRPESEAATHWRYQNCTFDTNITGMHCLYWSGSAMWCYDNLITNNGKGIKFASGPIASEIDEVLVKNAFYGNTTSNIENPYGQEKAGEYASVILDTSPYYANWIEWDDRWFLTQLPSGDGYCVDNGFLYWTFSYPSGKAYTTELDDTSPVLDDDYHDPVDIGYHYPAIMNYIYVDDINGSVNGDGSYENRFKYISDAIDKAKDDYGTATVTIYIFEGIYSGSSNVPVMIDDERLMDLRILGENRENVILDGGDSCTVIIINEVTIHSIKSLTIQNGSASCYENYDYYGNGGGIFCNSAPLEIEDCILKGNTANYDGRYIVSGQGGGVYCNGNYLWIKDCIFSGNTALDGGGIAAISTITRIYDSLIMNNYSYGSTCGPTVRHGGGGVYTIDTMQFLLKNSSVSNNWTDGANGGGIMLITSIEKDNVLNIDDSIISNNSGGYGGGIYATWVSLFINGSFFDYNIASRDGGGIQIYFMDHQGATSPDADMHANFLGCILQHNEAGGNNYGGAAIHAWIQDRDIDGLPYYDYVTLSNSLFAGNKQNYAIEFWGTKDGQRFGDAVITNCTIVDNDEGIKDNCQKYMEEPYFDPALINTIIYNNGINTSGIGWTVQGGIGWSIAASHCDIQGVWNETPNEQGNLSKEPMFVNTAFGEYHLTDSGNSGIVDGGENMGGMDIDGQERSIGASTDIGSDEYNPFRVIESITKVTNNNIRIDWNTVSGMSEYRVYSSTDEYGEEMSWELEYIWTTGATEWTDTIDCESIDFKYYKVTYTNALGVVIESDAVGFYNVEVTKGYGAQNTLSCPFWIADNTLGGTLGNQIKGNLDPNNTVRIWKYDYFEQQWHNSVLTGNPPNWSDGDIKISPLDSFDISFGSGSGTSIITLLGFVPQQLGNSLIFGNNDSSGYETGFCYPFPIYSTLNDISFVLFGLKGSTSSNDADKIVAPNSTYTGWNTVMWLRSDGKWRVGADQEPTQSQLEIKPCKGFYFQKVNNERKAITIKKPYEK